MSQNCVMSLRTVSLNSCELVSCQLSAQCELEFETYIRASFSLFFFNPFLVFPPPEQIEGFELRIF